jgi:actin-related protein
LRIAPEEHNIMIIVCPKTPIENKEKIAQIMFETFNAPGLYIAKSTVLALLGYGKFNGISIDLGEDITHFVPIYDFFCLSHAYIYENLGGKDLSHSITLFLKHLEENTAQRFSKYGEKDVAKNIKEKTCYVAYDFQEELKCVKPYDYELPDGTHVIIKDQRIKCPEALFKPEMVGKIGVGIAKTCCDSIERCDIDIRKDLYNCIALSGGNSMFKGLKERLEKEMRVLVPYSMQKEVRVISPPERKFASWIGGSILSSVSHFESSWITKTEYEENGSTIVHRKCF